MGLTNMAEASNIICDPEDGEDTLLSWLKRASLEKYQTTFAENGITEIANLEDVKEEDAIPLGLTKFEARRLARVYTGWKTTQEEKSRCGSETVKVGAKATYKTSTSSVVLSLPPVMKNFVETRDGMGNVVVSAASLKSKFSNLWYESPVCPRQTISNSFILQMASERFKYSKSSCDCELWCRKERSKRIPLLFGIVKGATLDNWSPHFKKQRVLGQIEIMKKRHPEIVSFKENERLPGKKHYDQLCKFVEGCQDALSLASKNIDICREEIETTMKNTKNGKVIRDGNEV